jgi:hypothetical protein
MNGQPTGLFFVVPRWRYWWIWGLVGVHKWPLMGWFSRRILARMQVKYHLTWLHGRKPGEA